MKTRFLIGGPRATSARIFIQFGGWIGKTNCKAVARNAVKHWCIVWSKQLALFYINLTLKSLVSR